MPNVSEVSRRRAFRAFVEANGSVLGAFNALKDEGYAIGRHTLNTWAVEDGWRDRLSEKPDALQAATAIAAYEVEAPLSDGEKVESTIATVCSMLSGIGKAVSAGLQQLDADNLKVDEILSLAKAGGDLAKVLAALEGPRASAPPKDVTPAAEAPGATLPGGGPVAGLIAQFDYVRK